MSRTLRLAMLTMLLCATSGIAQSNPLAWPHWGGPSRNFTVGAARLAPTWPAAGPRKLWSRPLGEGYSAIVAMGDRIYTMYRQGTREVVVALSSQTGRTIWEHPYDAVFRKDMNLDNGGGPHATPAIAGGLLFTAGGLGSLRLDLATGKLVWNREFWTEMTGTFVDTGYSSSPLIVGDLVIGRTEPWRRPAFWLSLGDSSCLTRTARWRSPARQRQG